MSTQSKPKVYVLDPYHPDAISLLQSTQSITTILPTDPARSNWHNDATALLLRSETTITAADLSRASSLKVIVKQGVGVNNIDLSAAKEHGVKVCNTPALNSEAVAEVTIALALDIARRVAEIDRRVRRGEKVVRSQMLGMSLYGKTLGVVGMGNIGKVVAKKWRGAMEGQVLAFDPFADEGVWKGDIEHTRVKTLEELLGQADVVSLHVPLTDGTRGMIGEKAFGMMKKDAILVNAARGGVVDEKALFTVLKEKKLWGVALDAMDVEPPTREAYGEMLENENIILTPHIGASTRENQSRSGVAVVETLLAVLEGKEVPNRVV